MSGDIAVPQKSLAVFTREEKSFRQSSAPVDAFHAEKIPVVPSVKRRPFDTSGVE